MRTLLITGCSSGIGLDAARTLSARGWRVFATCRRTEDCERLAAEGLESLPLDLASPDSIAAAVAEVRTRTGGRLDALYNNGAFAVPGAVEDLSREALRHIFETNLFGTHDLTVRVIPLMRAQGGGRIVTCSSVLGFAALPWRGGYVATKFALEGLSDVLRREMAGTGIHVSLIEPGPITSDFRHNAAAQFAAWVDWRASPRATQYAAELIPRLNDPGKDRHELPASAVTRRLIHALESPRPRARYFVTRPTWMAAAAVRLLPTAVLDRLLAGR